MQKLCQNGAEKFLPEVPAVVPLPVPVVPVIATDSRARAVVDR